MLHFNAQTFFFLQCKTFYSIMLLNIFLMPSVDFREKYILTISDRFFKIEVA